MFLIPSHQKRPSDDPIFALNQEAVERSNKGESIVNATVGALLSDDGTLAILPTMTKLIAEVPATEWATYAPISGSGPFLKAVMDDLLGTSKPLRAAAVAVATPGGSGALRHAIGNYLERGDALLTTSYFWGPYQTLADEADRRVETFRMFDDQGALDVGALDEKLATLLATQKRVLLFLNDPCQNPTGYSMSKRDWERTREVILRHAATGPITVLLDIAYSEYAAGSGEGGPSAQLLLQEIEPLIGKVALLFAWTASKSFTHYGLRVGALVAVIGDEAERKATENALSYSSRGTWSNCNRGGMYAVMKALTDPTAKAACIAERKSLQELLQRRVDAFNRAAREVGLSYPRYEGGFFVTVFPKGNAQEKAKSMRDQGVYVVPTQGALRVGLCSVAEKDVPRLVASLVE